MFDSLWPRGLQHTSFPVHHNSQSLLKLMSIESMMPSNYLILCHPLLLLPSLFPSIKVFSNELAPYIRWPKYWNFSFSISPSNKYSGLISFTIDWFDLLAVQGTLITCIIFHLMDKQLCFSTFWVLGFPGGSVVKHPSAKQEMWIWSLCWEDPLEKEMAIHSSIFAWEISCMDRRAWWAIVYGVAKGQTWLSN